MRKSLNYLLLPLALLAAPLYCQGQDMAPTASVTSSAEPAIEATTATKPKRYQVLEAVGTRSIKKAHKHYKPFETSHDLKVGHGFNNYMLVQDKKHRLGYIKKVKFSRSSGLFSGLTPKNLPVRFSIYQVAVQPADSVTITLYNEQLDLATPIAASPRTPYPAKLVYQRDLVMNKTAEIVLDDQDSLLMTGNGFFMAVQILPEGFAELRKNMDAGGVKNMHDYYDQLREYTQCFNGYRAWNPYFVQEMPNSGNGHRNYMIKNAYDQQGANIDFDVEIQEVRKVWKNQ